MKVVRASSAHDPALEVALSEALLLRVARGELAPTLRVYRPRPTVAFGRLDRLRPGFLDAARAARERGFEPVLRSPGGHAAAYDTGTVAFDLVLPAASVVEGVQERFARTSEAIASALRGLGVDARVGEVPGEYCRGAYTVNAGGRAKVVGTAQRAIRGGALLAGFVTVEGAERLRDVLVPVYAALELDWAPATLGDVSALRETGTGTVPPRRNSACPRSGWVDVVGDALVDALAPDASSTSLDDATRALADELRPRHAIAQV